MSTGTTQPESEPSRCPAWSDRATLLCIASVLILTCVPYLVVWWFLPLEHEFPGILFNSDDQGVYFAWMRQSVDGRLLFRNLFTADDQRGIYFQPFFLVLGWLARVLGGSLPLAYHAGRLVCATLALLLARSLAARISQGSLACNTALAAVCYSAGLGWLAWSDRTTPNRPVDVWQPEAITFPSLYTNALFAGALALMLAVVVCLLRAEEEGPWWAILAGACGLALSVVHSYDVLHLALVWTIYLIVRTIVERRLPVLALRHALTAACIAAPGVVYMGWLYLTEPVFRERADTPTWSPAPHLYVIGLGLLLPLAAAGGWMLLRRDGASQGQPGMEVQRRTALLLVVWPLAALAAAYLPVAFQRKLVMGIHLPLALLAGVAIAAGARSVAARMPRAAPWVAALGVLVLAPSNLRYLERDIRLALRENRTTTYFHPAYWPQSELAAFRWLGEHSGRDAVLFGYPLSLVLAPAYSGRTVYAGHWGETPQFPARVREAEAFFGGAWDERARAEFLRRHRITHVYIGAREQLLISRAAARGLRRPEEAPYLRLVWRSGQSAVYAVVTNSELP